MKENTNIKRNLASRAVYRQVKSSGIRFKQNRKQGA